jgi:hypothetical protein
MQSRIVLLAPLPKERKPAIGKTWSDARKPHFAANFIAVLSCATTLWSIFRLRETSR